MKDEKKINYGKHQHLLRRKTKESSLGVFGDKTSPAVDAKPKGGAGEAFDRAWPNRKFRNRRRWPL